MVKKEYVTKIDSLWIKAMLVFVSFIESLYDGVVMTVSSVSKRIRSLKDRKVFREDADLIDHLFKASYTYNTS